MKKIVLFLTALVLLGGAFVSYWVYLRYLKRPVSAPLVYQVMRGDLKDLLHVRGDVAAEREYEMAFNSFGTVAHVPVQEGQLVKAGDLLMRLDTTDLELQLKELYAQERRAQAARESASARLTQAIAARDASVAQLAELQRGTRPEALQVSISKADGAKQTLEDAEASAVLALKEAYTKADDAVFNVADQMISNPRSLDPQLTFSIPNSELRRNVELQRPVVGSILASWKTLAASVTTANVATTQAVTKTNLQAVSEFLDDLAYALNGAIASASVSAATLTTWQTNLSLARTDINLARSSVTDADATLRSAQSAYDIALNERLVLEAGTSAEQIAEQQAQVRQAEANIAVYTSGVGQADADVQIAKAEIDLMREKIRKASIYAPGPARVTKLWLKANEQYQQSLQGMPAVSLATTGIKVQSDISEIDIPKIHEQNGNIVSMVFDAFPDRMVTGTVVSIEPKELIKEGDTYYRVNFQLAGDSTDLRRGMSADVTIQVAEKKGILLIPAFTVFDRAGKKFVTRRDPDGVRDVEIQTGITDGEMVEVTSGLSEGQTIIVSTS